MEDKYNQIVLTTKDGRWVSIVQGGGVMGRRKATCEVWIEGEPDPEGYMTVEKLAEYLSEKCG